MNLKRLTVFFLVLALTLGAGANLSILRNQLNKDLNEALQYYNYMEKAYYSKDLSVAKADLEMAFSLADRIEKEGEDLLRRARTKLEEFWLSISYSPPATTKMAYLSAENLTKRALSKDLEDHLLRLKELGFNGIVARTERKDGTTLFPTGKQEQYRLLQGTDPLWELSILAKELDLDLFLVMNVGFIAAGDLPQLVLKHPDFVAVSELGEILDEYNRIYLNLSHPEVRRYYIERAKDLANYDFGALILDLDLPIKTAIENDYSYDVFSRDLFEKQYGYDPLKEKSGPRIEWNKWRSEQINSLLSQISRSVKEKHPALKVGAMVNLLDISINDLKYEKLLDWEGWLERGYINYLLTRVSKTRSYDQVLKNLSSSGGQYLPYPVYCSDDDLSLTDFLVDLNRLQLSGGFIFEDVLALDRFTTDALVGIINKTATVSLHKDPWRALTLNISALESLAPSGWAQDLRKLTDGISKLVMAPAGADYIEALSKVRYQMEYLKVRALSDNSPFAKRLESEINQAKHLLELGTLDRNLQGKRLH